ncbi:MAG: hypothetical protein HKL87_02835 [Acidimicrobiaceae bacterium]|nr:hypothetical protein [Acidimicrobiaceae bacterium]
MRRIIALLVVAVAVAIGFGLSASTPALTVNSQRVSLAEWSSEMSTLRSNSGLQCYYDALTSANIGAGAAQSTLSAAGAAAWSNIRVEGLAIVDNVERVLHHTPSSTDLSRAQQILATEMSNAALSADYNCPESASAALAAMPAAMRNAEVRAEADSLYLVTTLPGTVALTSSSLSSYFAQHRADYTTLCVSAAVVSLSRANAFLAAAKSGQSVAQLARSFSIDSSKSRGGALGCFSPGSSSYASLRSDVAGQPVGHYNTTLHSITYGSGTADLFLAVTSEKPTTYAQAATTVLADAQKTNASIASTAKSQLLFRDAVTVASSIGRWGLASSGPQVFVPNLPANSGTASSSVLTTPATTPYQ